LFTASLDEGAELTQQPYAGSTAKNVGGNASQSRSHWCQYSGKTRSTVKDTAFAIISLTSN